MFHVEHPVYGVLHYEPWPKQRRFHESMAPNCIMEGVRNTGKSLAIRMDAHMRAMALPGFVYLVLRRTLGELRKTQLKFIDKEMLQLGGRFNKTEFIAHYPNGSIGFFSHCETPEDMEKLLGGEYGAIYFDEMTTFEPEQITKISTCARVPEASGLLARVRGGTNPIGVGAEHVQSYYILKNVDRAMDPEYCPEDYEAIQLLQADNPSADWEQYEKRAGGLPEHIRRAWFLGEWGVEGSYFADFQPVRYDDENAARPWHVIQRLPTIDGVPVTQVPWVHVYRVLDWGWFPDPAVCLWIAVLPNSRAVVVKEEQWRKTTADVVARAVKNGSSGMRVVESYADPTMFGNREATDFHSIADIFATQGVPLTPSRNDRSAIGFAIHEWLNTVLDDGLPKLQIFGPGCPNLVKTIPLMRVDKHNASRIDDGPDHYVISLGYFCQGRIGTSHPTTTSELPIWMRKKKSEAWVLGRESTKHVYN